MTFPLYLCAHLIYGVVMAHVMMRRMRAEGEVIGVPLVVTLAPIGLFTAPLGAVLLRYAGGWFLHGVLVGEGSIAYERFHFGIMLSVMLLAGLVTVGGMFVGIAALSRDNPKLAIVPVLLALLASLALVVVDGANIIHVRAANNRWLFLHPAGLVSLAVVAVLVAAVLYSRARVANVMPRPIGPASTIIQPPITVR